METVSKYEVRCPSCDVTFPIGTKVCMHCGGRTAPSQRHVPDLSYEESAEARTAFEDEGWEIEQTEGSPPRPFDAEEPAGEKSRPPLLRALVTLVWVILAIAFSVLRSCSEGEP